MEKITYVSVTEPRLDNIKRNLEAVLPYVDRCLFILGKDETETKDYLDSMGDKVEYHYYPWPDSFAEQYNKYLLHIDNGWVLLCDDDELPSDGALQKLRSLVEASDYGNKFCCVEFRSWSINPWDNPPKDHPDDYWRKIFFRYNEGMSYGVNLHQCLMGYQNGNHIRSDEVYYHIKTPRDMARNACRNYFISGIWPSGVSDGIRGRDWEELHQIVDKRYKGVNTFGDLDVIFKAGDVHQDLKEWLIKYKNFGSNLYHELHHYFEYYFEFLHPDEYTEEVKEKVAEYASIKKPKFSFNITAETWTPPNDTRELGISLCYIGYKVKGKWYKTGLVNPNVELEGFNGVESVRNDLQFAWSQQNSTVTIYGSDKEDIEEIGISLIWPPQPGQEVFLHFGNFSVFVSSTVTTLKV